MWGQLLSGLAGGGSSGGTGGMGGGNSSSLSASADSSYGVTNNAAFMVGGSGKSSQTNDNGTPSQGSNNLPLYIVAGLAGMTLLVLAFKK